jgi:hypothetical protein
MSVNRRDAEIAWELGWVTEADRDIAVVFRVDARGWFVVFYGDSDLVVGVLAVDVDQDTTTVKERHRPQCLVGGAGGFASGGQRFVGAVRGEFAQLGDVRESHDRHQTAELLIGHVPGRPDGGWGGAQNAVPVVVMLLVVR